MHEKEQGSYGGLSRTEIFIYQLWLFFYNEVPYLISRFSFGILGDISVMKLIHK